MPTPQPYAPGPQQIVEAVWQRRRWILIPAIVGGVAGLIFAITMPRRWEASQGLHVRQEVTNGAADRPGSFSSLSEMKTLQETILEVARSQSVIRATLEESTAEAGGTAVSPSDEEIELFRKQLRVSPPSGAEFGMTEVFYLQVRAKRRDLALTLVDSLCGNLIERLRELRDIRAQSMISELEQTVALADSDLNDATAALVAFESEVGADLAELRMLESSAAGTSDIRQNIVAMENAKRPHETQKRQNERLMELLEAAKSNPRALIATPNSLLASQPSLRILKDGLVRARLKTARLQGMRSPEHPLVMAAVESEREVLRQFREELSVAIQGVRLDLRLATDRIADLDRRIEQDRKSLERLAELRATYANLNALAKDRTKLLETARKRLADARAAQASARSSSLISRIDGPETGVNPAGPGRTVIVAAGFAGGGLCGLGVVFLFGIPSAPPTGFAVDPHAMNWQYANPSAPTAGHPPVSTPVAAPVSAPAPSSHPPQPHAAPPASVAASRPPSAPAASSHSESSPPSSSPQPPPSQPSRPQPKTLRTAQAKSDEVFGMFAGMTLREAMESTQKQDKQNPPADA